MYLSQLSKWLMCRYLIQPEKMELKYKRVVEVEQNLHHVTDNDSSTSYEILKYWRTIAI